MLFLQWQLTTSMVCIGWSMQMFAEQCRPVLYVAARLPDGAWCSSWQQALSGSSPVVSINCYSHLHPKAKCWHVVDILQAKCWLRHSEVTVALGAAEH